MTPPRRWLATLAGLTIALVGPAILTGGSPDAGSYGELPANVIAISELVVWALTLAVLAIIVFWERRPLISIGLGRPTWASIGTGGVVTAGLLLLAVIAEKAIESAGVPMPNDQQAVVFGIPVWLQIVVAGSAGFCEEVLFRGYAIERLTELTRSRWLGAAIPIVVFGAVHAPFWGVAHALVAGLSGLWLTLLYLWRRNLWINITAHALLDGLAFVAADLVGMGATG